MTQLSELMRLERYRRSPPQGYPSFPDIPGARYTSAEFFALEQSALFRKSWLLAGHLDEIPQPRCHKTWDMAGEPLVIVHARSGAINAFYNTCLHRGAPIARGAGKHPLVCGYHGWAYDDEGRLVSIRHAEDFIDFDMSCRSLRRVRCELFGKLIFVNFDDDAPDLREWLGPVAEEWGRHFAFDRTVLVDRHIRHVDSNWKIAMESNCEVYHVPLVHPKTVATRLDERWNVNVLFPGGHGRMCAPLKARTAAWKANGGVDPVSLNDDTVTTSYNMFPNWVSPLGNAGFPVLLFWPDGPGRSTIEFWWFAIGDYDREAMKARIEQFDAVIEEDMQFCAAIQKAQASAGFDSVPLSYQEERIYHWHQSADRIIGGNSVPEGMRVDPVIGDEWIGEAGVAHKIAALTGCL